MKKQTILIINDQIRTREELGALFKGRGSEVLTAASESEGFDILKKYLVKVIIFGIRHSSQNNADIMDHLRKTDPFIQVVFITEPLELIESKKPAGLDVFRLIKKAPVDNMLLLSAVEMAVSRYDEMKSRYQRKEKERMAVERILGSLDAIVYVSDMETYDLLYTNRKFDSVFGYKKNTGGKDGKCWQRIQGNPTGPCVFCTKLKITDDDLTPLAPCESEQYNDKTHRWYKIVFKAIEWFDSRLVRLGMAYDITEKVMDKRLFNQGDTTSESVRHLESLGTLAGGIAHKFNNSLSVITGHLNLIDAEFPENEQLKGRTHTMLTYTKKMSQLTAALLAYGRGGTYLPQTFILSKFIEELLEHIKFNLPPTITVVTDFSDHAYPIHGDKTQIRMLLSEVMENALEAMDRIGTIKIVCEKEKIAQRYYKPSIPDNKNEYICLSIIDDGRGMDKETKEKIFDPFFTTQFDGRGIGLSAAYGIVKSHNGYIFVDSQLGKGSTIKIFLPIKESHGSGPREKSRQYSGTKVLTILLVEDETAVMEVTKTMLEKMGHKVLEAPTGKEAIHLVKSYKDPIDLAFLDFLLPDMNGDIVYPFLAEERPEMKTIILSGYAITKQVQTILDAGAKAFLQKPVTMSQLSEQINSL